MALPRHRSAWRGVVVLLLAVALLAGLVVAGRVAVTASSDERGVPTHAGLYAYARDQVLANMRYPGSELLQEVGTGDTGGKSTEYAGVILSSSDSPETIYAWYASLAQSGEWVPVDLPRLSTQESIRGYRRGNRELFYVAKNNARALAATLGHTVTNEQTVFETVLYISPG